MTDFANAIDEIDRRIILASQNGLPLVDRPYAAIAGEIGIDESSVLARMKRMLDRGVIRRIGAVPNHYALGMRANGMSVWDVDDKSVSTIGKAVGELDFVSHCYRRPRRLPVWPYNLFAMVHGRDRGEVDDKVQVIAEIIGPAMRGNDVLYSTKILKKTGLRIAA